MSLQSKDNEIKNKKFYDTLNIKKDATQQEIKKSYRKLALKYHPDKNKTLAKKDAENKFRELTHAYKMLTDKEYSIKYNEDNQYSDFNINEDEILREVFEIFGQNMDFMNSFFMFNSPSQEILQDVQSHYDIDKNFDTDINMVANMFEQIDMMEKMVYSSFNIPSPIYNVPSTQFNKSSSYNKSSKLPYSTKKNYSVYTCKLSLYDIYNMKKKKINVYVSKSLHIKEEEELIILSHIPCQIYKNKKIIVKIKDKFQDKINNTQYYYSRYNKFDILLNYPYSMIQEKDNNTYISFKYLDDETYNIKLSLKYKQIEEKYYSYNSSKNKKNNNFLLLNNKGLYNYKLKKRNNLYVKII